MAIDNASTAKPKEQMLQHIIFPCDIPYTPMDRSSTAIGLAFIDLFMNFIHDLFSLFTAAFEFPHDKWNAQHSVNIDRSI